MEQIFWAHYVLSALMPIARFSKQRSKLFAANLVVSHYALKSARALELSIVE